MSGYFTNDLRTGSGIIVDHKQGAAAIAAYSLVRVDANGQWALTDADAAATMPCSGITGEALVAGNKGKVLLRGLIGNSAWTWTPGDKLYAGVTAGAITAVKPTGLLDIVQQIGVALSATEIIFDPDGKDASAVEPLILEGETAFVGFDGFKEPFINYFLAVAGTANIAINAAEAYVTALGGGTIMIERGTYAVAAGGEIVPTGGDIWYKGQGTGTLIDGDSLLTGEHLFNISGQIDVTISDMMVQTEDGGGKTSHCIFIEDVSNRFMIDNVLFLASDDQGVHVEGTATVGGSIINCEFIDTDGTAIMVDMDGGADLMTLLEIKDNNIASAGQEAIELNDTEDSQVVNNIIETTGADGILLETTADNNLVEGNTIRNWTGEPIDNNGQDNIVKDNDCGGDVFNSKGMGFATVAASLTSVGAQGGWVEVPAGTFAESVTVPAGVWLRGEGHASIIDGGTTGTAVTLGTNCILSDIQVSTTQAGTNAFDGVVFAGADAIAHNVYVSASDRHGISFTNAGNMVLDCRVMNCDDFGIRMASTGDDSVIDGCTIEITGDDGVNINGDAENCIVDSNRITAWTNECIDDDSGTSTIGDNECT